MTVTDRLLAAALTVERNGTPSQVGPHQDELRDMATEVHKLERENERLRTVVAKISDVLLTAAKL